MLVVKQAAPCPSAHSCTHAAALPRPAAAWRHSGSTPRQPGQQGRLSRASAQRERGGLAQARGAASHLGRGTQSIMMPFATYLHEHAPC